MLVTESNQRSMQVSTFRIEDELFGIPTLLVEELFRPLPITRVPGADHRIDGVVNIRGTTAVVVNMRACLGREPLAAGQGEMILLESNADLVAEAQELGLRVGDEPLLLLVDENAHIYQLPVEAKYPPPAHISKAFVQGVAKSGNTFITMISVTKLIEDLQPSAAQV